MGKIDFDQSAIDAIKSALVKSGKTIAVAESVTGGVLQAAFTQAKDASMFFHGGTTCYNLGQKARHLKVNAIHAEACDSVSKNIAEEMARGVQEMFGSDYGIGLTGYAATVPERGINSLFCFAAGSHQGKIIFSIKILAKNVEEGLEAQIFYANRVLKKLLLTINK